MLLSAVESVHLERGVDTCPELGGRPGEQAGGVGQFLEQGGVFGGRLAGGKGFQFGLGGLLVETDSELIIDAVALRAGVVTVGSCRTLAGPKPWPWQRHT